MYIYTKAHFPVDIKRNLSPNKKPTQKRERRTSTSFKASSILIQDGNTTFPSVTPSSTPSVSITPSMTPSISVTPSVTPSITPSVMPNDAILLDDGSYLLVGYNEYLKFIDP